MLAVLIVVKDQTNPTNVYKLKLQFHQGTGLNHAHTYVYINL